MTATDAHRAEFDRRYESHLRHLKLKGLQPKTIEAYARGIRPSAAWATTSTIASMPPPTPGRANASTR